MKRSKVFRQVNDHTTELYDKVTKIQTQILDKITSLKKNKNQNNFLCEHLVLESECPPYNSQTDYYDLFWKTFLLNEIKKNKIQSFTQYCNLLGQSIQWIERKFGKYEKLVRYRTGMVACYTGSKDGERFQCKIQGCGKTYQSLGALDLHHKIKHESEKQDSQQSSFLLRMDKKQKTNKSKH